MLQGKFLNVIITADLDVADGQIDIFPLHLFTVMKTI